MLKINQQFNLFFKTMEKHNFLKTMLLLCALVVGNSAWAEEVTLTSAQIKAGSGSTSYGSCSATDGGGNTWSAYAIKNQHSNNTSDYHFWQIKKYASNTAYYIQVPELGLKITSIEMTVSSTSKAMTGGENDATLFFSNSNATSATGTGVASGTGVSSVTIDCSSLNLNTGYITASGAVRIWEITVKYNAIVDNRTPVNIMSFTSTSTSLVKGETTTTIVTNDQVGWSAAYTYSSDDENVATISDNGIIEAVAKGATKVWATLDLITTDATYKKGTTDKMSIDITVSNPSHAASFSVNGVISSTLDVEEGETVSFPDNPEDFGGKYFVGWTATPIDGSQDNEPVTMFAVRKANEPIGDGP